MNPAVRIAPTLGDHRAQRIMIRRTPPARTAMHIPTHYDQPADALGVFGRKSQGCVNTTRFRIKGEPVQPGGLGDNGNLFGKLVKVHFDDGSR